ncbi:hypothetical protein L7F22_049969 [Adiantum nelumboides]|nr:hypothetical protein [Adiantum nelumboides]
MTWSNIPRRLLRGSLDSGLHTDRFDSVLDTMVSFASINLRGKLLAKLRRVIAKTAQNPTVAQLHENGAWKEIATLVRMNMVLSFTSRMESLIYLPELLHIILLLAGNGVDATRHSIHGTAINLIHSLCTGDLPRDYKQQSGAKVASAGPEGETGAVENAEGMGKLRNLLDRFSNEESLALFGLPTHSTSAFARRPLTPRPPWCANRQATNR